MIVDAYVFTGQIREIANFRALLGVIRSVSPRTRIRFSTWENEEIPISAAEMMRQYDVGVTLTPPVRHDAWGSPLRQQVLLDRGMTSLRPDDVVFKLRSDWVLHRPSLEAIVAEVGRSGEVRLRATPPFLRSSIVIPWWNPQIPFRLADEAFVGLASDLAAVNRVNWFMSAADPHTGRFIDLGLRSSWAIGVYYRQLMSIVFPEYAVRFRKYFESTTGISPSRLGFRVGAQPLSLMRALASTPVGEAALADYHFIARDLFRVVNPTPESDQFITRVGGPWSAHGYVRSDGACPLMSDGFLVSYDAIDLCAGCLNGSHPSSVYSARAQALRASDGRALSTPLPAALVELSRRVATRSARQAFWSRVLSSRTPVQG